MSSTLKKKKPTAKNTKSKHDTLQQLKKKSTKNRKAGGDGWVRVSPAEHEGLKKIAEGLKKARLNSLGRPPKSPEDVGKVRSLRLSDRLVSTFEIKAEKAGFGTWQEWAKSLLMNA